MINKHFWITALLLLILLGACTFGSGKDKVSPEQVYTQAAETVQAQLTRMAEENSTPTPTLTATDNKASATPEITDTPEMSTATPGTEPTPPSACTNRATFIDDVTYPDGAIVSPGEQFTKTWKMMNSGTCTWTTDYKIVFINSDGISVPDETPLTTGIEVPAGAQYNITVQLTAPDAEGTYTAYFKFKASDGTIFGINADGAASFYVKITVAKNVPTATETANPTITPSPTLTPTPNS